MEKSSFRIPKMDCSAEEQLVRMKLEGAPEIRGLAYLVVARGVRRILALAKQSPENRRKNFPRKSGGQMNKSMILSRLAMAGIASGMLALGACNKTEKSKAGSAEKGTMQGNGMSDSSMMNPARMDTVKTAGHGCKGMNACKGQGGCAVSAKDLKELAAKAGIPLEKAGKAHGCKGMNACKGLGGCKS